MKLILPLVLLGMVLIASAQAWELNDTTVRSNGLNSQFEVTYPWVFNQLTVDAAYIYFGRINQSTTSTNLGQNYSLSFNFTEQDKNYTGRDIPYLQLENETAFINISIINNLSNTMNITVNTTSINCTNRQLWHSHNTGAVQYWTYPEFSCDGLNFGVEDVTIPNGTSSLILYDFNDIPPVISVDIILTPGFQNWTANITMICTHPFYPENNYTLNFNGVDFFSGNLSNGTELNNGTIAIDGTNAAYATCSNPWGNASLNYTDIVYAKYFALIDEKENAPFNLDNCSGAKIYYDDNSTLFDFKAQNTTVANFTSLAMDKLRVELEYSDGTIITRYVDVSLVGEQVRICANKEGITHYEQLIISASEKAVVMRNVFSNCLIAADYTRFAYQDAKLLKAFTIDSLYYLYTFDEGQQVYLASVDGSIATYINLDTLEFQAEGFNINVLRDTVTFERSGPTEVKIYYRNLDDNNDDLALTIENMDVDTQVLSLDTFADNNEFTLYFDYGTLSNVTNTTVFQLELTRTQGEEVSVVRRYFTPTGSSGILNSAFAFVIAVLITIFGLTFTISRLTFSWFGIFILLASIGFLSFAITTWYITMLMAIDIIILVYAVILMTTKNYPTVS